MPGFPRSMFECLRGVPEKGGVWGHLWSGRFVSGPGPLTTGCDVFAAKRTQVVMFPCRRDGGWHGRVELAGSAGRPDRQPYGRDAVTESSQSSVKGPGPNSRRRNLDAGRRCRLCRRRPLRLSLAIREGGSRGKPAVSPVLLPAAVDGDRQLERDLVGGGRLGLEALDDLGGTRSGRE